MYYQLTYIVPADAADPKELEKIISSISSQITEVGGALQEPIAVSSDTQANEKTKLDETIIQFAQSQKANIFKQRLAYHVKHHRYGFFISNIFSLTDKNTKSVLDSLKSWLKANKNILRFMIVNFDLDLNLKQMENKKRVKPAEETPETKEITAETKAEEQPEKEILAPEKSKKTKIEDLDEKLEQILNT